MGRGKGEKINETLELARLESDAKKFELYFELVTTVFHICGILAVVWLIMDGLGSIVLARPDQISALAKLTGVINIVGIVGAITGVVSTAAFLRERRSKIHAIIKLGDMRKLLEAQDAGGRSSSNLTNKGGTPEDLR